MRNEPNWLTSEELAELNQYVVASTGEPFGILKPHELESAAQRPYSLWAYGEVDDVASLAVRLFLAVAQDHPFKQGNKRTGFIAATIFLEANGWFLDLEDYDEVAELIESAVTDDRMEGELIALFQERIVRTA